MGRLLCIASEKQEKQTHSANRVRDERLLLMGMVKMNTRGVYAIGKERRLTDERPFEDIYVISGGTQLLGTKNARREREGQRVNLTNIHTYIQTNIQTYIQTSYKHTNKQTYIHTVIHT